MYIAVAGNIGSGKTTLTEILARRYGWKPYYEETDNPYIDDFYQDMSRWAFNLQVYFLGRRMKQVMEIAAAEGDVIQDRTIYEDAYIFATNLHQMGLMVTRDYEAYMEVFEIAAGIIKQPDLLVYLKAGVPTLISQIQRRGRAYEMGIQEEYLERLNRNYDRWITEIYPGRVVTIDVDKEDFILHADSLDRVVTGIDREVSRLRK